MDAYFTRPRPKKERTTLQVVSEIYEPASEVIPPDTTGALLSPGLTQPTSAFGRVRPGTLPPYTAADVEALNNWTAGTISEAGCALWAVLVLALGAGLDLPVLRFVKGRHVWRTAEGLVVHDPATRAYPVVVNLEWECAVGELAAEAGPDGFLVLPNYRYRYSPSFMADLLRDAGPRPAGVPPFDHRRLRTTWIVEHLQQGTGAAVLLRITGLRSFGSLDRYLDFVVRPGDRRAMRALRRDRRRQIEGR